MYESNNASGSNSSNDYTFYVINNDIPSLIEPLNSSTRNIFVPGWSPAVFPCVVIQNATTIRAYRQMPAPGTTRQFTDFFFNAGARYMSVNGTQTFGTGATMPTCIPQSQLTSDFWHRTDIDSILITFIIVSIFIFYIPLKIFSKVFKKGG